MRHHEETIAAFADELRSDDRVLAVIVTGSVARGTERADSDVDVCVLVDEQRFREAAARDGLSYVRHEPATYDGGYVDVKIISPLYLDRAITDADQPTRASFLGARIVWSRHADLADSIARVTNLTDEQWDEALTSFIAQLRLYSGYFLPQAVQLEDDYLLAWAAVHLAGAAGRALLAHARVLYPGPKYLRTLLRTTRGIPDEVVERMDALTATPSHEAGLALAQLVEAHVDAALPAEAMLGRFVADNELAWFWQRPTPESL